MPKTKTTKNTPQTIRRVAVVRAKRTAFCKSFGLFSNQSAKALLVGALQGLIDDTNIAKIGVDEVAGGAVLNHSDDFNLVRESVLETTLPKTTPAYNVQQACGTSLQSAFIIMAKIASGQIDSGIACGVDTVSKMPFTANPKLADRLLKLNKAKSFSQKRKCLSGFSLRELMPRPTTGGEQKTMLSMGQHCELMAREWNITRDAQDKFTLKSHHKAQQAFESGFHKDLITPHVGVYTDTILRPNLVLSDLEKLRPAFDRKNGTITAGNATALTDGASAVLLCSEDWAKEHNLDIEYIITHVAHGALDFVGGEGLLMAPTIAVDKVLNQSGYAFQDFDFYELHEAFSAQTLCFLSAMDNADFNKKHFNRTKPHGTLDMDKVNLVGSSLAYGHPFAATGGRILGVCGGIMRDNPTFKRGLIAICTAGGMGLSAIVERP